MPLNLVLRGGKACVNAPLSKVSAVKMAAFDRSGQKMILVIQSRFKWLKLQHTNLSVSIPKPCNSNNCFDPFST
jgi:hypothetical protein